MFDLVQVMPERGSSCRRGAEDIGYSRILSTQQFEPQTVSLVLIVQAPNPFCNQGNVEETGVQDAKTTLVLGSADVWRLNPVELAFLASSFPEESASSPRLARVLLGTKMVCGDVELYIEVGDAAN
jgi:hypothetical protein